MRWSTRCSALALRVSFWVWARAAIFLPQSRRRRSGFRPKSELLPRASSTRAPALAPFLLRSSCRGSRCTLAGARRFWSPVSSVLYGSCGGRSATATPAQAHPATVTPSSTDAAARNGRLVAASPLPSDLGLHARQISHRSGLVVLPVLAAAIFQLAVQARSVAYRAAVGDRVCHLHDWQRLRWVAAARAISAWACR